MKLKLYSLGLTLLSLLAPIKELLLATGFLIVMDLITGLYAAYKRKEQITSAALGRTISKVLVYQIAIISGFVLQSYLLEDFFPVAKLIAGIIGLTETTSILENVNSITKTNVFKELIKKLSSKNQN